MYELAMRTTASRRQAARVEEHWNKFCLGIERVGHIEVREPARAAALYERATASFLRRIARNDLPSSNEVAHLAEAFARMGAAGTLGPVPESVYSAVLGIAGEPTAPSAVTLFTLSLDAARRLVRRNNDKWARYFYAIAVQLDVTHECADKAENSDAVLRETLAQARPKLRTLLQHARGDDDDRHRYLTAVRLIADALKDTDRPWPVLTITPVEDAPPPSGSPPATATPHAVGGTAQGAANGTGVIVRRRDGQLSTPGEYLAEHPESTAQRPVVTAAPLHLAFPRTPIDLQRPADGRDAARTAPRLDVAATLSTLPDRSARQVVADPHPQPRQPAAAAAPSSDALGRLVARELRVGITTPPSPEAATPSAAPIAPHVAQASAGATARPGSAVGELARLLSTETQHPTHEPAAARFAAPGLAPLPHYDDAEGDRVSESTFSRESSPPREAAAPPAATAVVDRDATELREAALPYRVETQQRRSTSAPEPAHLSQEVLSQYFASFAGVEPPPANAPAPVALTDAEVAQAHPSPTRDITDELPPIITQVRPLDRPPLDHLPDRVEPPPGFVGIPKRDRTGEQVEVGQRPITDVRPTTAERLAEAARTRDLAEGAHALRYPIAVHGPYRTSAEKLWATLAPIETLVAPVRFIASAIGVTRKSRLFADDEGFTVRSETTVLFMPSSATETRMRFEDLVSSERILLRKEAMLQLVLSVVALSLAMILGGRLVGQSWLAGSRDGLAIGGMIVLVGLLADLYFFRRYWRARGRSLVRLVFSSGELLIEDSAESSIGSRLPGGTAPRGGPPTAGHRHHGTPTRVEHAAVT